MLKITAGAKRHFKDYKIIFWDPLSPALTKLNSYFERWVKHVQPLLVGHPVTETFVLPGIEKCVSFLLHISHNLYCERHGRQDSSNRMESTLARLGVAAKLTVKQQFRKKSCIFLVQFPFSF